MNKAGDRLLSVSGLRKGYTSGMGRVPVLKGVHLELRVGEMAVILGRSGSGKSTLLHLIGGLDKPTAGQIFFEGRDITSIRERDLAHIRNVRMGFVFQFYHLLPELTLYENVLLPSLIAGHKDREWPREVLRRVKLLSRQSHYPSELSGGEQQRAALARALVNRPALVLCDEPTGNLDEETAEEVMAFLNDLNRREGQSFIMVTHDETLAPRQALAYRLQDGLLVLKDGSSQSFENAQ